MAPISSIRNLGPAMEKAFAKAGITTAEELRALGTDEAYLRLLKSGHRAHFIAYYALEMSLQGRPWNDCKGAEKDALRTRFDTLKERKVKASGSSEIDRALAEIGVLPRAQKP